MKEKKLVIELDADGVWLVRRAISRATEVMKDGEDIRKLCELDAQIGQEADYQEKREQEEQLKVEVPKRIEEMADKLDDAVRLLRGIKGSFKMLFANASQKALTSFRLRSRFWDIQFISLRL